MKTVLISFFLFFAGILCAQDKGIATIPADAIQDYLAETKEYSVLYSGKFETPYDQSYTNHPYLETAQYVQGTLCYNQVVYQDIFMRLDLFRDELSVAFPTKINRVVLEKEKFNYAVINGLTVFVSTNNASKTGTKYMLMVKDGIFPVVKQYRVLIREEVVNRSMKRTFLFQEQYFVYIGNIACPVKNKNDLLTLFADKKKELNDYANQRKLNFRKQFGESVIALVEQYEAMIH